MTVKNETDKTDKTEKMQWNSKLYDDKHSFVSKYGEGILGILAPNSGESILDLGCGTGDLTNLISTTGAKVLGIDSSTQMIDTASAKFSHINFYVKNALDFKFDAGFDAIFSNAVLHWILDAKGVLENINKNLKQGGRFVAEFGGAGNVESIVKAIRKVLRNKGFTENSERKVWFFPSLCDYVNLAQSCGFKVIFANLFERDTLLEDKNGIKNWLSMFGERFFSGLQESELAEILQAIENELAPTNFRDGNWYADYMRLQIVAIKE